MLLICLFVVSFLAMCIGLYFWGRYRTHFARNLFVLGLSAVLVLGLTIGIVKAQCETNATNLTDTYNELAMYHQTVTNSTNEYIRNHYYNEVQEYNKNYEDSLKKSSNMICNVFYPKNTFKEISTINFELRGDAYVVPEISN